jgi:hypothetical protein
LYSKIKEKHKTLNVYTCEIYVSLISLEEINSLKFLYNALTYPPHEQINFGMCTGPGERRVSGRIEKQCLDLLHKLGIVARQD